MMSTSNTKASVPIHDIIIVGAGPCGLAVAARMRETTPSALFADFEHQRYHWLQKHFHRMSKLPTRGRAQNMVVLDNKDKERKKIRNKPSAASLATHYSMQVLDSTTDTWMGKWKNLFRALEIQTLRSPLFFHPDPRDRDGLKEFAYANGREKEMIELKGIVGKERSKHEVKKARKRNQQKDIIRGKSIDERDKQDYYTPSTVLFDDYCQECIGRYELGNLVEQTNVESINFDEQGEGDRPDNCFTIRTSRGIQYGRTVVMAIGAGTPSPLPISTCEAEGACHSSQLSNCEALAQHVKEKIASRKSTNVIVVGGGLTSAQIADMCVRKGVTKVWNIMRSDFKTKHFDLPLDWVAKNKNLEMAYFFGADNDEERFRKITTARNGGSITPAHKQLLETHKCHGRLVIHERTTIKYKFWDPIGKLWAVQTEPPIENLPCIDFIYFATGAQADIKALPFLQPLLQSHPIDTIGGLPCLTDELQWNEKVPLFVAGRFAGLRLGPGAANLEGARVGAERIVCRLQEILESFAEREKMYDIHSKEVIGSYLQTLKERYQYGSSHLNMYDALDQYTAIG